MLGRGDERPPGHSAMPRPVEWSDSDQVGIGGARGGGGSPSAEVADEGRPTRTGTGPCAGARKESPPGAPDGTGAPPAQNGQCRWPSASPSSGADPSSPGAASARLIHAMPSEVQTATRSPAGAALATDALNSGNSIWPATASIANQTCHVRRGRMRGLERMVVKYDGSPERLGRLAQVSWQHRLLAAALHCVATSRGRRGDG